MRISGNTVFLYPTSGKTFLWRKGTKWSVDEFDRPVIHQNVGSQGSNRYLEPFGEANTIGPLALSDNSIEGLRTSYGFRPGFLGVFSEPSFTRT